MSILAGCALLCAPRAGAFLVFEKAPRAFPGIGLSFRPPAEAHADPLDLPRANGYLVTGRNGKARFEDRFDVFDLWVAETVLARWYDDDGNRFTIARLTSRFPTDSEGTLKTRTDYLEDAIPIQPKEMTHLREAAFMASPFETSTWETPRRGQRKNLNALYRLAVTNVLQSAYVFRPVSERKGGAPWYLVTLQNAKPEDATDAATTLDAWLDDVSECAAPAETRRRAKKKDDAKPTETDLARRDFKRNIENYDTWTFSDGGCCYAADELKSLPGRAALIASITNSFPKYRALYAERCPTPLSEEVPPAAVRVFADRDRYLDHVGNDAAWTAAIWSPEHRELVLYLPEEGTDELLRTVRHEAFHQYLDCACATIPTSPWFNEGHAQLFQHATFDRDGKPVFEYDPDDMAFVRANATKLADLIPAVLFMDYEAFYATETADAEVRARIQRTNYRLAWSMVHFLEVGAPEVRFAPFATLRADYLKALLKTRRMRDATRSVFTDDKIKLFVREWLAFFT